MLRNLPKQPPHTFNPTATLKVKRLPSLIILSHKKSHTHTVCIYIHRANTSIHLSPPLLTSSTGKHISSSEYTLVLYSASIIQLHIVCALMLCGLELKYIYIYTNIRASSTSFVVMPYKIGIFTTSIDTMEEHFGV